MAAAGESPLTFNGDTVTHPNLYVRNLPPNMDQTAVEVLFRRFGTCTGCKFFKTAAIPYAFLRLSTPAEALAAIKALNGTHVSGRLILVKPADSDATYDTPNENLYVRNIPVSWNDEDIRQFFEKFGPTVSVRVLPPLSTSVGQVAMVRFQHLDHAQAAREGANATVPPGEHLPLNVKFADNQDEKARKIHSRMVKATSNGGGAAAGGPAMHRYAPYPGANAPPGFGMPPMGISETGELLPFGPPGVPGMQPPPEVLGVMGLQPPPWAADPAVMFGVPPPPPPPPPRQQPQQPPQGISQQAQPPSLQHLPQQQQPPPVVAIAVDMSTGQFMMPQPGGPGLVRPPQQLPQPVGSQAPHQQPQQFPPPQHQAPVVLASTQPPGLQSQSQALPPGLQPTPPQPRPAMQQPSQPHMPQPGPQPAPQPAPQPQSNQPMPGAMMQHPQQAGPLYSAPVAQPPAQPYGGQPSAPPSQAPTGGPPPGAAQGAPNVNAAVPGSYPGYDGQAAQHYGHQPYPGGSYAYPGYSHDPYAQAAASAAAGHPQPYDAQAAAYYAAYYGHPQPAYGQPPPAGGTPGQPAPAGQASGQAADPYQAYQAYYYQYYGAMAQQGQQAAQQQAAQPQQQAPQQQVQQQQQQVQQQVPQANGAVAKGGAASAAVSGAPTAAGAVASAAAPQLQQAAAPWHGQQQPAQQQPTAAAHITAQPNAAAAHKQQPAQGVAPPAAAAQPATTNTNRLAGAGMNGAASVNPTGTTTAASVATPSAASANGNSAAGVLAFKQDCRVMISNLPSEAEKVHMYESFAPYGPILGVHVTGGFGVVMYSDREAASRAAAAMNGAVVKGARIKVTLAEI